MSHRDILSNNQAARPGAGYTGPGRHGVTVRVRRRRLVTVAAHAGGGTGGPARRGPGLTQGRRRGRRVTVRGPAQAAAAPSPGLSVTVPVAARPLRQVRRGLPR